jgi:hypothetical protein
MGSPCVTRPWSQPLMIAWKEKEKKVGDNS